MLRVVLATRNAHKVAEICEILDLPGIAFETLDDHPQVGELVEDGDSFEANALIKAREVARVTGLPALADDSGLVVDALGGAPGVYSARFAGPDADDAANRALVVEKLGHVPQGERTGGFVCVLALVTPDGNEQTVEGRCPGHLVLTERGSGGFGYDPLFVPEGESCTFAEMSSAEKAAMSHRGRALAAVRPLLAALLDTPKSGS